MNLFPDNTADFAALRAAHHDRHGLTIAYIKKKVGAGTEYANEVARAVVSPHGGYYELAELPEEFAGALGAGVTHQLIAPADAWQTLMQVQALATRILTGEHPVRAVSLFALYAGGSLRTRRRMFVLDQRPGEPPFAHGAWQPDLLPRFLKLRLDCGEAPAPPVPGLETLTDKSVLFLLAPQNRDDGHALLATLTRTPGAQDFSTQLAPTTVN